VPLDQGQELRRQTLPTAYRSSAQPVNICSGGNISLQQLKELIAAV
jgi:hypothetical protein